MARKKTEQPIIVEVIDNTDLIKNTQTGTVIFRNTSAIEARKQAKEKLRQEKEYVSSLEERICQLEKLIQELVKSN